MATVLICEPHDDIYAMFEIVVRRLGHEPIRFNGPPDDHPCVEAGVIEPGAPDGFAIAKRLRERGVPLLLTSIFPPDEATLALDPAAYLVKPFPLRALERALAVALAAPPVQSPS